MKKQRLSSRFLSEKRANKTERARRKERVRSRGWPVSGFGYQSYLHDYLQILAYPAGYPNTETVQVSIPETFSFIEAPEECLKTIAYVADAGLRKKVRSINFDHSKLKTYDLAAEAVLDVVAMETKKRLAPRKGKLRWAGKFPADSAASRFVRGAGISRFLTHPQTYLRPDEQAELIVFEQHRLSVGDDPGPFRDDKGRVVTDFADHVNSCLNTVNLAMSASGRASLCAYTGELIDNVEQHARSVKWYVAGYLDTSLSPPMCEIAIFNFGRSFSQTFADLPPDAYARKLIGPYLEAHRRGSLFSNGWREDDLVTLVALQGGISSKATGPTDTRGNGSVDLVRFFQSVCRECNGQEVQPRMAILSGRTHILFDGTYQMGQGSSGRWQIAFNSENSLALPPDGRYVRHMDGVAFPGTVVSIRFPLPATLAPPPRGEAVL